MIQSQHSNRQVTITVTCLNFTGTGSRNLLPPLSSSRRVILSRKITLNSNGEVNYRELAWRPWLVLWLGYSADCEFAQLVTELKVVPNQGALWDIHTLQLNFLFPDWLFSKYAESIENVHCIQRTAPRPRKVLLVRDNTRLISTDPFFSLGKVVNILYVKWHFKSILFIIFHENEQMILFFCRVWIRLINLHLLMLVKMDKSNALARMWCLSNALGPVGLGHWTHPKFSACALDLSYLTRKSKCAFINL